MIRSPDPNHHSVLVVGVYLSDSLNMAEQIVSDLEDAKDWKVRQRWVGMGTPSRSSVLKEVTAFSSTERIPKFTALNALLKNEDQDSFDFVLVCDDDISLPPCFLDNYLSLVLEHDFALAQPGRTADSFIDHHFVRSMGGLRARRTRFVEIGPLFSIRRDAFGCLLPFDETSPMGWGFDFVWPLLLEAENLRMGIIDATPVQHSIRKPVANYGYEEAKRTMEQYLLKRPHLSKDRAFTVIESYA